MQSDQIPPQSQILVQIGPIARHRRPLGSLDALLQDLGLRVTMLTGDNPATAGSIDELPYHAPLIRWREPGEATASSDGPSLGTLEKVRAVSPAASVMVRVTGPSTASVRV